MIFSMTGFGKAVVETSNRKFTAEIKSLNSKQLDLQARIPQQYRECELPLRNIIATELERGKVDLIVTVDTTGDESQAATINKSLAKAYKRQIEEMAAELGIPEPTDWYTTLLRLPDMLKAETQEVNKEEIEAITEVVKKAIEALKEFRAQEGARLEKFFGEKIAEIQNLLNQVPQYEEERVTKIRSRIIDSLSQLDSIDYDKNRLEQEMIFYIEKLDINEEKLRLQNHLDYFMSTMQTGHGQGKKLGFISQEMGREINTLGSKANQAELQRIVVRMKDQLEQIKEQVLNVM